MGMKFFRNFDVAFDSLNDLVWKHCLPWIRSKEAQQGYGNKDIQCGRRNKQSNMDSSE